METQTAVALCRDALSLALSVSLPILIAGAAVGLVIGLIQAATQIQEQTLALVAKLIVMSLTALWLLPWILARVTDYSRMLFESIPETVFPPL